MYKVKKEIKIAYNEDKVGLYAITMPDNQKIKLTEFPLKTSTTNGVQS